MLATFSWEDKGFPLVSVGSGKGLLPFSLLELRIAV